MNKFDLAIVGAGPGGYVTAIKAASMGYKTVLFEKEYIGGVCLNVGCIPTKTMIKSAHLYHEIHNSASFGLNLGEGANPDVDWDALMARKNGVVSKLTGGVGMLLKGAGVTVVKAFAEVKDSTHIVANGEEYEVKNMILALGSSPSFPNVKGMKEAYEAGDVIDSTGILNLKKQPKKLVVIGGGVIALEFAVIFNALGTDVTMIQRSDYILTGMDMDLRKTIQKLSKKNGIDIVTGTKLLEVNGKKVKYEKDGEVIEIEGDEVLVSLGRKPNTKGIEALNLEMDGKRVKVDEYYRTSIPNIYAIGDMSSSIQLAHVASAEGLCALDHLDGKPRTLDYNKMPACVYGFPEVASIGLTEEGAKEQGLNYETVKFMVSANGRSMASGEVEGFVKIIADKEIGEILGAHIVAGVATDLISEILMVMQLEGTVEDIALAVHPHPTNSEMIMEAAHMLEGYPIHMAQPKKK